MFDLSRDNSIVLPFLKWVGGKRWFTQRYSHLFPKVFGKYVEPFLGSGAVYFHLKPQSAVLGDINAELINAFVSIKRRPDLIARYLRQHERQHSATYYYRTRAKVPKSPCKAAARTIYLNRTCWNALYRVNQNGAFNVPIGSKTSVILDSDNFKAVALALRGAELLICDFEETLAKAEKGDFAFVDPPYTVQHDHNGFLKYNERIFSWADQLRLHNSIKAAVARGAYVLATNANHSSVRKLYSGFNTEAVKRASVISGRNSGRGDFYELVIRSW